MQLVIKLKNRVLTTSVLVAEKFGREHKDLLRAIRSIECSEEFSRRNFTPSDYDVRGKKYPMVIMTRDGFTLLMMSLSGPTAAKFKEEFIDEFNRMEAIIKQGDTPKLIPVYSHRILSEPTRDCPKKFWNVFDMSHSIFMLIEKHVGSMCQFDLVDGSIGIRWAKYREDKPWKGIDYHYIYHHEDKRGDVQCRCYLHQELEHFKIWLHNEYKPKYLFKYMREKYAKNTLMLDKINEFQQKMLIVK